MIYFYFFIFQVNFVLFIEFHYTSSISCKILAYYVYYCIKIRYSDKFVSCFFLVFLKASAKSRDVTPRLGGRGVEDFSFSIVQVNFAVCKLNLILFFPLFYSAVMLCLLLLYLIRF